MYRLKFKLSRLEELLFRVEETLEESEERENNNNVPTGGNKPRFDCGQGGRGGGNKGEVDLIEAATLEGVTGEAIH